MNNTGWICPRCRKVNAPDVKQCDCSDGYCGYPYTPVKSTPWYPVVPPTFIIGETYTYG